MDTDEKMATRAGYAAVAGGALGLASLVAAIAGEATQGQDFMGTAAAELAGWASFVSSALLVVGLVGLGARYAPVLSGGGRSALLILGFATAMSVGAASTLALMVPELADRAPELLTDPPAAVPPTFIFSGLVMGVCAIMLAVGLRRAGVAPRHLTSLLIVGAVVAMVPLPSRYFLLSLAIGLLLLARVPRHSEAAAPVESGLVSP